MRNRRECMDLGRTRWSMPETVRSLCSDRTKGLVGRYVATDSCAGRSLRSDLVWTLFWYFMNVFLDYGCLVSMNQPRLVQDFTAKFFEKISLRRLFFVKVFILIFTNIWMLTSSCMFLTPTIRNIYDKAI